MLNIISAVLAGLVKQGVLVRDVATLVDRLPRPKKTMKTFTEAESRRCSSMLRSTGSYTPGTWRCRGSGAASCAGFGGRMWI